jgi:hypothetical protein
MMLTPTTHEMTKCSNPSCTTLVLLDPGFKPSLCWTCRQFMDGRRDLPINARILV